MACVMRMVFPPGLSIMLNVEEDEYVRSLTNRVGFKVTVHNVAAMPFPEDEGFDISPGFATSVGVQKVSADYWKFLEINLTKVHCMWWCFLLGLL